MIASSALDATSAPTLGALSHPRRPLPSNPVASKTQSQMPDLDVLGLKTLVCRIFFSSVTLESECLFSGLYHVVEGPVLCIFILFIVCRW